MEACALVRTEHLNHYGHLFGGQLLCWVDEFAWVAATRQFPGKKFVTRAMEKVEFRQQVGNGEILTFKVTLANRGHTSLSYAVEVHAHAVHEASTRQVFTTKVVLVAIDEKGAKQKI